MNRSPIESWIGRSIGVPVLTPEILSAYQNSKLRETLEWARARCPFYARRLKNAGSRLTRLPFTEPGDLRENPSAFVCVSQSEISRIVTLKTSGTTGTPKRIYFTTEEQKGTIDFFRHALTAFTGPQDRVLITLPSGRPGSAGELLATAIRSVGATAVTSVLEGITCVIGSPAEVLALARGADSSLRPHAVALCSDHVSQAIVDALRDAWNCQVFEHYGSTEMGFGGGVDCEAHQGYHMGESDLLLEIVDPVSGVPLPDGEPGEVVFTTLTRRGMPLIRYRTGDISRRLSGACPCGSFLPRLERLRARKDAAVPIGAGQRISICDLDEALFAIRGLTSFTASVDRGVLDVIVSGVPAEGARQALLRVPAVAAACLEGSLTVTVQTGNAPTPAGEKRSLRWAA